MFDQSLYLVVFYINIILSSCELIKYQNPRPKKPGILLCGARSYLRGQ